MPLRAKDPERPPKSRQEEDLDLLPLVLHRAELSINTDICDEKKVIPSLATEDCSKVREPKNRRK